MRAMKNGVSYYTKGIARIEVGFPEDNVCCHWCPWCKAEWGMNRSKCRLTDEIIYDTEARGQFCPVELEGES